MDTKVISGKELAQILQNQMKDKVDMLYNKYGRKPKLAVILVGDDAGSVSYVKGKEKACLNVGIENLTIKKPLDISQDELLGIINELNCNPTVDGILVQLPLPKHINETYIINSIAPTKDVDGFHPANVASLYLKQPGIIPCTPKGIIQVIESAGIKIQGKRACVVGRSNIVGLPVAKLMTDKNATVTIAHSKTENLQMVTKEADILIVAIGRPKFIKKEFVKEGAVVIDVGVNRDLETNKLCGDVDFDDVFGHASYITKVPGGIGPMTITCLMENTLECYLKHVEEK